MFFCYGSNTVMIVSTFVILLLTGLFDGRYFVAMGDKSKSKPVVSRIIVNGHDDLVLKEGDNPCKVLIKYCKSLQLRYHKDTCFTQLHPIVLKQLTAMWQTAHTKLKVEDNFFIDCNKLTFSTEASDNNIVYDTGNEHIGTGHTSVSRRNSSAIQELLMLLERAMQRDTSALNMFNVKRNELNLSDMEKVQLYRQAILMLPNNLFVVDQLGLALMFVDKEHTARKLWSNAVARGLWGNPLQRPVSRYVPGLTSKPWYNTNDYPFIARIEVGYKDIKSELMFNLRERHRLFTEETENLHVGGEWTELRLKSSGYGFTKYTEYFPKTMHYIHECGQTFTSIKFSAIQPGTHIRTHTGPTNERLRLHLCLYHAGGARIRVGTEWHTWEEGKVIMFDDSWEHEVIHTGQEMRIVLILDIWHPELPENQRIVH